MDLETRLQQDSKNVEVNPVPVSTHSNILDYEQTTTNSVDEVSYKNHEKDQTVTSLLETIDIDEKHVTTLVDTSESNITKDELGNKMGKDNANEQCDKHIVTMAEKNEAVLTNPDIGTDIEEKGSDEISINLTRNVIVEVNDESNAEDLDKSNISENHEKVSSNIEFNNSKPKVDTICQDEANHCALVNKEEHNKQWKEDVISDSVVDAKLTSQIHKTNYNFLDGQLDKADIGNIKTCEVENKDCSLECNEKKSSRLNLESAVTKHITLASDNVCSLEEESIAMVEEPVMTSVKANEQLSPTQNVSGCESNTSITLNTLLEANVIKIYSEESGNNVNNHSKPISVADEVINIDSDKDITDTIPDKSSAEKDITVINIEPDDTQLEPIVTPQSSMPMVTVTPSTSNVSFVESFKHFISSEPNIKASHARKRRKYSSQSKIQQVNHNQNHSSLPNIQHITPNQICPSQPDNQQVKHYQNYYTSGLNTPQLNNNQNNLLQPNNSHSQQYPSLGAYHLTAVDDPESSVWDFQSVEQNDHINKVYAVAEHLNGPYSNIANYCCNFCVLSFATFQALKQHEISHQFSCNKCEYVSRIRSDLHEHQQRRHSNLKNQANPYKSAIVRYDNKFQFGKYIPLNAPHISTYKTLIGEPMPSFNSTVAKLSAESKTRIFEVSTSFSNQRLDQQPFTSSTASSPMDIVTPTGFYTSSIPFPVYQNNHNLEHSKNKVKGRGETGILNDSSSFTNHISTYKTVIGEPMPAFNSTEAKLGAETETGISEASSIPLSVYQMNQNLDHAMKQEKSCVETNISEVSSSFTNQQLDQQSVLSSTASSQINEATPTGLFSSSIPTKMYQNLNLSKNTEKSCFDFFCSLCQTTVVISGGTVEDHIAKVHCDVYTQGLQPDFHYKNPQHVKDLEDEQRSPRKQDSAKLSFPQAEPIQVDKNVSSDNQESPEKKRTPEKNIESPSSAFYKNIKKKLRDGKDSNISWECFYCDFHSCVQSKVVNHIVEDHQNEQIKLKRIVKHKNKKLESQLDKEEDAGLWSCYYCEETENSREKIIYHVKNEHPKMKIMITRKSQVTTGSKSMMDESKDSFIEWLFDTLKKGVPGIKWIWKKCLVFELSMKIPVYVSSTRDQDNVYKEWAKSTGLFPEEEDKSHHHDYPYWKENLMRTLEEALRVHNYLCHVGSLKEAGSQELLQYYRFKFGSNTEFEKWLPGMDYNDLSKFDSLVPWLHGKLHCKKKKVQNLEWVDREQGVFKLPCKTGDKGNMRDMCSKWFESIDKLECPIGGPHYYHIIEIILLHAINDAMVNRKLVPYNGIRKKTDSENFVKFLFAEDRSGINQKSIMRCTQDAVVISDDDTATISLPSPDQQGEGMALQIENPVSLSALSIATFPGSTDDMNNQLAKYEEIGTEERVPDDELSQANALWTGDGYGYEQPKKRGRKRHNQSNDTWGFSKQRRFLPRSISAYRQRFGGIQRYIKPQKGFTKDLGTQFKIEVLDEIPDDLNVDYSLYYTYDYKTREGRCLNCNYTTSSTIHGHSHLREHVMIHTGGKLWGCAYCNHKCNRKGNICMHTTMKHPNKERKIIRRRPMVRYFRSTPLTFFTDNNQEYYDYRGVTDGVVQNQFDGRSMQTESVVKEPDQFWQCPYCSRRSVYKTTVLHHLKFVHPEKDQEAELQCWTRPPWSVDLLKERHLKQGSIKLFSLEEMSKFSVLKEVLDSNGENLCDVLNKGERQLSDAIYGDYDISDIMSSKNVEMEDYMENSTQIENTNVSGSRRKARRPHRLIHCQFCKYTTKRGALYFRHVLKAHDKKITDNTVIDFSFQCNHCTYLTNNLDDVREHVVVDHPSESDKLTTMTYRSSTDPKEPFNVEYKRKSFNASESKCDGYQVALSYYDNQHSFLCFYCEFKTSSVQNVKIHLRYAHPECQVLKMIQKTIDGLLVYDLCESQNCFFVASDLQTLSMHYLELPDHQLPAPSNPLLNKNRKDILPNGPLTVATGTYSGPKRPRKTETMNQLKKSTEVNYNFTTEVEFIRSQCKPAGSVIQCSTSGLPVLYKCRYCSFPMNESLAVLKDHLINYHIDSPPVVVNMKARLQKQRSGIVLCLEIGCSWYHKDLDAYQKHMIEVHPGTPYHQIETYRKGWKWRKTTMHFPQADVASYINTVRKGLNPHITPASFHPPFLATTPEINQGTLRRKSTEENVTPAKKKPRRKHKNIDDSDDERDLDYTPYGVKVQQGNLQLKHQEMGALGGFDKFDAHQPDFGLFGQPVELPHIDEVSHSLSGLPQMPRGNESDSYYYIEGFRNRYQCSLCVASFDNLTHAKVHAIYSHYDQMQYQKYLIINDLYTQALRKKKKIYVCINMQCVFVCKIFSLIMAHYNCSSDKFKLYDQSLLDFVDSGNMSVFPSTQIDKTTTDKGESMDHFDVKFVKEEPQRNDCIILQENNPPVDEGEYSSNTIIEESNNEEGSNIDCIELKHFGEDQNERLDEDHDNTLNEDGKNSVGDDQNNCMSEERNILKVAEQNETLVEEKSNRLFEKHNNPLVEAQNSFFLEEKNNSLVEEQNNSFGGDQNTGLGTDQTSILDKDQNQSCIVDQNNINSDNVNQRSYNSAKDGDGYIMYQCDYCMFQTSDMINVKEHLGTKHQAVEGGFTAMVMQYEQNGAVTMKVQPSDRFNEDNLFCQNSDKESMRPVAEVNAEILTGTDIDNQNNYASTSKSDDKPEAGDLSKEAIDLDINQTNLQKNSSFDLNCGKDFISLSSCSPSNTQTDREDILQHSVFPEMSKDTYLTPTLYDDLNLGE